MAFALKLAAFSNGGEIPRKYTCSGENLSPALSWSEAPPKAHALALIADDPDAPGGTWTHWVLFNLPAQLRELEEGVPVQEVLASGAKQGKNDFGKIGYGGPAPPRAPLIGLRPSGEKPCGSSALEAAPPAM